MATTAAIAAKARTRLSSLGTWRPFTLDWAEVGRPAAEHYRALTKALTFERTDEPRTVAPSLVIPRRFSLPRAGELQLILFLNSSTGPL
jgi:phosphatidylserine decarboxylase